MTFPAAAVLCLIMIAASPSFARQAEDTLAEGHRWVSGSLLLEGGYNDNIMEYSPREISEAAAGIKPTKYLVTDPADLYGSIGVRLDVTPPVADPEYRTRVRLRYNLDSYDTNPIKSHHLWGAEINQRFLGRNYLAIRYDALPEYYLRNLYYHRYHVLSRYPSHYARADITKDIYAIELGRTFTPSVRLAVNYTFAKTGYTPAFTERDSKLHAVSLETDFRPSRPLRLSLDYTYSLRWARGRDNFNDPAYDSLADISAQYHQASAGASYDLKRIVKLPVGVQARLTYEREGFLSGKPGDIYHFGRVDQLWNFSSQLDYGVLAMLELFVGYRWEQSRSNLGETGDAGNYQVHSVSTGATISF
jgi:hypothetical protein